MHVSIRRIESDLRSAYPQTNRVYIEAESLPLLTATVESVKKQEDIPWQHADKK